MSAVTATQQALLKALLVSSGAVSPNLVEPSGAIPQLWIPMALVGNIFAFYWLYR